MSYINAVRQENCTECGSKDTVRLDHTLTRIEHDIGELVERYKCNSCGKEFVS